MSTPAAAVPLAAQPLRIRRVVLTDFRAFPGPTPVSFGLDGKNLLVYGENGAGKSSLFHALREFFAPRSGRPLRDFKNVFSGQPDTACAVAVEFNDGTPSVSWTSTRRPASVGTTGADPRVIDAALRRACLDYRALLDTNYKHGHGEINLFEVAVNELLRDYPVPATGGVSKTLGELWSEVQRAMPDRHIATAIARVNQACVEFNTAFRVALPALVPLINQLLAALGWGDVVLGGFRTPGLTYNQARLRRERRIDGQILSPELTYRTHPLTRPQTFLNEARLSALALAIYLAGRRACTQGVSAHALKLLVLDDVLIGLDHSNRLPVLDVIGDYFADWQVVLLTHDRLWYESAKLRGEAYGGWVAYEMFERTDPNAHFAPRVERVGADVAQDYLTQASAYVAQGDLRASAVYARSAYELILKKLCNSKGVPVSFSLDQHKLDTDDFLRPLKKWTEDHGNGAAFSGLIAILSIYRGTVLNPGSHSTPTTLNRAELAAAIRALRFVTEVPGYAKAPIDPLDVADRLLKKNPLADDERPLVVGYLRHAFVTSLRRFCIEESLALPFTMRPSEVDVVSLWQAARPMLFAALPALVTDVESRRPLFLDVLTTIVVIGLDKAWLTTALGSVEAWIKR